MELNFMVKEEAKEEAKREAKWREINQELKKLAGGYEFKPENKNFYIHYDYTFDELYWSYRVRYKDIGTVYFETEEDVKNAMKEIGEEVLIRDYFGIDDE